jgi:hypothetical protein
LKQEKFMLETPAKMSDVGSAITFRRAHGYSRRAVLSKQKRELASGPDSLSLVCRPTG